MGKEPKNIYGENESWYKIGDSWYSTKHGIGEPDSLFEKICMLLFGIFCATVVIGIIVALIEVYVVP
jgi:hypothetical protein